jgi:thioesterase domain-containing protein
MLDTLTPLQHFPLNGKLCFWTRRAFHHGKKLRQLPWRQLMPYLTMRTNGLAKDLKIIPVPGRRISSALEAPSLKAAGAAAFTKYRPRFYPGAITFIQAEVIDEWVPYYPDLLWSYFAQDFILHRVGGDHWNMLSRHPDQVAAAFARCLNTIGFSSR